MSTGHGHDADCSVTSEISEWLLPPVVPSVEIHTSRFDEGVGLLTGMLSWPGGSGVGAVRAAVSTNLAGVAVSAERICTTVPLLSTSTVTPLWTSPKTVKACTMRSSHARFAKEV